MMDFERVRVGEFFTNCYVIFGGDNALLIDPAFETDKIEKALNGHKVTKIILTHGHLDHFYELNYFKEKYNPVVYIHEDDLKYINNYSLSLPAGHLGNITEQNYSVDKTVKHGDIISFEDYCFEVIHTPGHTQGSVCLLCEDNLFCGDTLFNNSIGRSDFPLSDYESLTKSLKSLMLLDDNIKVFPGHGFSTSIGNERNNNQFIKYILS